MKDRELDALVAEKVMGWELIGIAPSGGRVVHSPRLWEKELPHYSSDIAAAWQVVEKMEKDGWESGCETSKGIRRAWFAWDRRKRFSPKLPKFAEAEAIPRAICLAALKAVGAEVPA